MSETLQKIARFRRQDVLVVLPLTMVAAAGALVWLPWRSVGLWVLVNLGLIGLSQLLCLWAERQSRRADACERVLAAFTFIYTAVYATLPLALAHMGSPTAMFAGRAMFGAITLSCIGEFVVSAWVGSAALAAVFLSSLVAIAGMAGGQSAVDLAVATIADLALFAYVTRHALARRQADRDLKRALEMAERSEKTAQSANAAKSAFLATMSHEIRTPLNGVLGMAQVMAAGALSKTQLDRLKVIEESGETLLAIINDVLDLAKIEAGKLECEHIAFDLDEVVGGVRTAFAKLAEGRRLGFHVIVEPAARCAYRGDPMRVRQILNNLISNALKFTEHGAVTVSISRDGDALRMAVSDTGIGMPPDRLGMLFNKFTQLDTSTTRSYGGTGLGLAICRELCELMGGSVGAESVLGQGSTFTAIVRLERVADAAEARVAAQDAHSAHPWQGALRILAAEDNAVNQLVLKTLLAQTGNEPVVVADGAQALRAWMDAEWDLVLMDIQMPVMDGLAAVRAIRAHERASGRAPTPIIALTANAMAHQRLDYDAAGMDDCVTKPIRADALFGAIDRVLGAAPGRRVANVA